MTRIWKTDLKKRVVCLLLCLMTLSCNLFAVSVKKSGSANAEQALGSNAFDSIPMLEAYYNEALEGANEDYWDACQISLVTVGQGDALYSWFGHSAFLVELPDSPAYVYDYGTFSFDDEDFYVNFAMGRLWFCCSVTYASYELAYLQYTGRTYHQVKLNLTAAQKKAIINFLILNASDEHNTYLYNHYTDNCATRLRDILNYATGGNFQAWATQKEGRTFRQLASSALSRNPLIQWVLEFLQSGQIDGTNTLWDEMFLPSLLESALLQYGSETGLISSNTDTSEITTDTTVQPKNNLVFSLLVGLTLGLVCYLLLQISSHRGFYKAYTFTVNLIFGLLGTLLAFMMFFTNHNVTWYNENLLFVNPLLLVMAVLSLRRKTSQALPIMYRILLGIMAALVVVKLLLPGIFLQDNWCVFLMIAPYYASNAFFLNKKPGGKDGYRC